MDIEVVRLGQASGAILLLIATFAMVLTLQLSTYRSFRQYGTVVNALLLLVLAAYLLVSSSDSLLFSFLTSFALVFMALLSFLLRLERYKTHDITRRAYRELFGISAIGFSVSVLQFASATNNFVEATFITAVQWVTFTLTLTGLAMVLVRSRNRLRINGAYKEMPSLTWAVPARNETHALTQSLDTSLDNDYEKLEVLVLDDCSSDKTPEIIKSFARAGVRFLEGTPTPEGWLGKTHAYEQLYKHASGEYIIFSGVDVHIAKQGFTRAIAFMKENNLDMISIAPERRERDIFSNALQALRYAFQLAAPRSHSGLSSVWAVRTEVLTELGGFAKVQNSMQPERSLAKQISRHRYRFILSSDGLFTTRKLLSSQIETLVRTSYPAVGSSLVSVLIISIISVSLLWSLISSYHSGAMWLTAGLVALVAFLRSNSLLLRPFSAVITTLLMPILMVAQLAVLVYSMVRYEQGEVGWKERNVCIPVLSQKKERN